MTQCINCGDYIRRLRPDEQTNGYEGINWMHTDPDGQLGGPYCDIELIATPPAVGGPDYSNRAGQPLPATIWPGSAS